ncbi:SusC/RagA family TonB-linked outer membrane protein [Sphingobacterium siyangense]|uniref:SusC/RagA family TonB-linked outer membrane protein n=1 Tax=Sphingobacterium siyangense TaxID=459529 RepID=UPI0031F88739
MKSRSSIQSLVAGIACSVFMIQVNPLFAQQIQVKGLVKDSKTGLPLSGVTIRINKQTRGSSDDRGQFVLQANSGENIEFRLIGYEPHSQSAQSNMSVVLTSAEGALEEVVVVGYGTQKKATLTGAVETVSSKAFEDRAVTNVALALQGQTPGLTVTRTSPRPGNEGLNLSIRGASSVNGSKPLIVIDGVPALNDYSFLNLNSDDIENISVLKDGAAAIYGSRAANGVLLVTTKKGKGKLKVDYNGNFRFNTNGLVGYSPSMQEYATMWLESNKEETVPNWWVWGEENLKKMAQGIEGRYDLYNTDFYIFNANRIQEMFSTRYSYQHNLSLGSGNEKTSYRLSFAYADNKANLATAYDGQKQWNGRFAYTYNLTEKLKLESNISLINANTSMPSRGLGNILYSFDMPFYPAKNPMGQWLAPFNGIDAGSNRNAAATSSDAGRSDRKSLTGRVDLRATYDVWNGISLEAAASLQNERYTGESYVVPVKLYNWYGDYVANAYNTDGTNNVFTAGSYNGLSQYYEALLRYNKTVGGKHNISAMVGINAEKFNSQTINAGRVGFDDLGIYDISAASTNVQTNGGGKSLNGRYSYVSRFTYNYAEKYLLELMGRYDGNSRFAKGHKFKGFGSVQAGWVFSEESFMSSLKDIVSFGKLRGSYASTGNAADDLRDFDYLSLVNIGTSVIGLPPSQQTSTSLANNGLISYDRTWETVLQKNIGLDLKFLRNRLSATFDVYEKKNIGMLVNVVYPSVLGGSAPKTNSGRFFSRGWELSLGWKDTKGDFSYNFAVNMGDANTKVSDVENADTYGAGRNNVVNGYPFKSWFLYKTDGYFKDQADVNAYYDAYGKSDALAAMDRNNPITTLRPGDTKRVDVAGTGNITAAGSQQSSLVYAGDGSPHYTFGINLGGSWKGFDLNAFLQGHLKQNIMRTGYMAYPFRALYTNQNPSFLGHTWTEENPNAEFPRLTSYPARAAWNYDSNDFMLQNSRYIRLKSLVVGYSLPKSLIERLKLQKVRVYFSGNDLWEKTAIKDGFDPETGENATDGDNAGYPFARTWSFGINLGF